MRARIITETQPKKQGHPGHKYHKGEPRNAWRKTENPQKHGVFGVATEHKKQIQTIVGTTIIGTLNGGSHAPCGQSNKVGRRNATYTQRMACSHWRTKTLTRWKPPPHTLVSIKENPCPGHCKSCYPIHFSSHCKTFPSVTRCRFRTSPVACSVPALANQHHSLNANSHT